MKNSILKIKLLLMVLGAVLMLSCSTENGEDGAIGPQGIAGVDGINGEDGNANVIISEWFNEEFSDDLRRLDTFSIENDIFNEDTGSNAVLLVYGRRGLDGVFSLPVVFDEQSYFYFIDTADKSLTIVGQSTSERLFTYKRFREYRYAIIPGNTADKTNSPDFSKMTYEQVMDYFKLEY